MRKLLLVSCSLCLSATVAMAQGKVDSQWTCSKPSAAHSLDVGDQSGHAYAIAQFNCTATKGEIEGVKEKEGMGTEFDDAKGKHGATPWCFHRLPGARRQDFRQLPGHRDNGEGTGAISQQHMVHFRWNR